MTPTGIVETISGFKKPILKKEDIELQIQMIEKDIALYSQKLFQAQGALMLMKDMSNFYRWNRKKNASRSPVRQ